ncbi:MAG: ACT domain-containing protein [Elusimicrobiota bacterium]|nr:ACT domain-containing protein [Elusimicrobiota bacterium]
MKIKQISVFLENKKGCLSEVTGVLSDGGINIRALSLADTADFGVLRLVVDEPARCVEILSKASIIAKETDVIAVEVEDRPGGLDKILKVFDANGINVEYMYATVEKTGNKAVVVFKIDEYDKALDALGRVNIQLVSTEKLKG